MYFYDLTFDGNKVVFPEYLVGQIVILNDDFTIDTTIFDEGNYGYLFWGVYTTPNEYIFTIYKSRVIRKYIKKSKIFVDVEVKDLPKESEVQFKHDEVFVEKDKIIIITSNNEVLVSDLSFSKVKYIKCIYKGKLHAQIVEDNEFIYIPIEKTIFRLSKNNFEISVYVQLDQIIDVIFMSIKGLWVLTNDLQLINLDCKRQIVDVSTYIHFYGNKQIVQIWNYINAYCYKEKVLFVPCYCEGLLILDLISNQITELVIENEKENERTLNRGQRKNTQKYIASCQKNQYVLLLSSSSEIVYLFDFKTSLIRECPSGLNSKFILETDLAHKKILGEQPGGINLVNYIEYITNR